MDNYKEYEINVHPQKVVNLSPCEFIELLANGKFDDFSVLVIEV